MPRASGRHSDSAPGTERHSKDQHPQVQVEFADVVLVNKVDSLPASKLPRLLAALAALNPGARVLPTEFGRVAPAELVGARRFDADAAAERPGWLREINASAMARAHGSDAGAGSEHGRARVGDRGAGAGSGQDHAHEHAHAHVGGEDAGGGHAHVHAGSGRQAEAAKYGVSTFVYHATRCGLRALSSFCANVMGRVTVCCPHPSSLLPLHARWLVAEALSWH